MPAPSPLRADALSAAARDVGLDAFLVTRLPNVRYLCGFTGSSGALLVGGDGSLRLAVDDRYTAQAAVEAPAAELLRTRAYARACAERARSAGARQVGIESHDVSVELFQDLSATFPELRLVPVSGLVEGLRRYKDEDELHSIRAACAASQEALDALVATPLAGRSERSVAGTLVSLLSRHGDGPAFDPVIGSGPHAAIPHHRPGERPLTPGDLLVIDFGAAVDGYAADMTRTLFVGGEGRRPADWQREIHDLSCAAAEAARAAVRAGSRTGRVFEEAWHVIEGAGYADRSLERLGHGLGLEVHEKPIVGLGLDDDLTSGMVLAVEPGIYLPGRGGVRVEDVVLVRDPAAEGAGSAEVLTTWSRELVEVA